MPNLPRIAIVAATTMTVLNGCHDTTSPNYSIRQSPALGSMGVGDVRVLTYAQAQNGVTIPDSLASAIYAIIVANAAADFGSVSLLAATGNRLGGTASEPIQAPTADVQSAGGRAALASVGGAHGAAFETALRAYERQMFGGGLHAPAPVSRSTSLPVRATRAPIGSVPEVGAHYTFNVPGKSGDLCNTFDSVAVTVASVHQHAVVLVDDRAQDNGFTAAYYDSIATEFDHTIYPTDSAYYGNPTDIDQNGHVYLLFTPSVNELTPAGMADSVGFVAGYTFAGDFLPTTGTIACAESNRSEIVYLMVPDATGEFGNVFTPEDVASETRATMAHEFEHAINAGTRIAAGQTVLESAWLDEALASMAEDNVGRVEAEFGDLQRLALTDVQGMNPTTYATFFRQNLSNAQAYATRPDTIGPVVPINRVETSAAAFGAGWAFVRYATDWFSSGNARAFTRALVAGPDTGTTNLAKRAGVPFDSVLAHWLITMYTDGRPIANLPDQYNYKTYALREILSHTCANVGCTAPSYLPVTPIGDGFTALTISVPSTSAAYFVTTKMTGIDRTIRFTPEAGSFADPAALRVYVVRLQ